MNQQRNSGVQNKRTLSDVLEKWMRFLVFLFLAALMVVIPFYFRDGYTKIATRKTEAFLTICYIGFFILVPSFVIHVISADKNRRKKLFRLVPTDIFLFGFLLISAVSAYVSVWPDRSWTGAQGWYMGLRTFLCCFGIYFFASRYITFRKEEYSTFFSIDSMLLSKILLGIMMAVSAAAFIWGILDRLEIRPIPMKFAYDSFAGPVGNINWFAGYFSLCFPLGLFLLFVVKKPVIRVLCGIHAGISVVFGILEGSDSVWIAMIISGVLIYLYASGSLKEKHPFLRLLPVLILGVLFIGVVLFITVNTKSGGRFSDHPFLNFNSVWGTFRGADWRAAILSFWLLSPLKKFIGVGPDCFGAFAYSVPEIVNYLSQYFGRTLENPHCEFLGLLVDVGIGGTICFYGAAISAAIKGWRKRSPFSSLFVICIVSYLLHNLVSFHTVMNLPFFFMFMGMCVGACRE